MQKLFLIFLAPMLSIMTCHGDVDKLTAPASDLGHVDLVVDSNAFHSILQDSFLRNEFAVLYQDTTMYSKPSYDIYLLGQEAFLHISLAKEYWDNKAGSGVMIFQSRKPGKDDSLYNAWKQFYPDSLLHKTFKGGDFDLGEILPYRKKDTTRPASPGFTPILTSYSEQAYKNWGFNDSMIVNGVSMKSFMHSWDTTAQQRLFKKIKALHVQVTDQEFKEMKSALETMGYQFANDHFMHTDNPVIYFSIIQNNKAIRYQKIEIELSSVAPERIIHLGNTYTIRIKDSLMNITQMK